MGPIVLPHVRGEVPKLLRDLGAQECDWAVRLLPGAFENPLTPIDNSSEQGLPLSKGLSAQGN